MFTNSYKGSLKAITGLLAVVLVVGLMPTHSSAFESRGNTSAAKWVSQTPGSPTGGSMVIYANPGSMLNFSLIIKNTSRNNVFYSAADLQDELFPYKGAHELRVGATDDVIYNNIFDFSGSQLVNNNRFVTFESGKPVNPGDQLTFYWNLRVKDNISNGTYRYAVGVVQEFDAWLGDQPGPGAGGPNNNLGGRSGGTIFWDIVIGGSLGYNPPTDIPRILVTANSYGWYDNPPDLTDGFSCSSGFNTDLPNSTDTYTNYEKGISVDLPFNSNWGTAKYRILPYESTPGTVRGDVIFGWIAPFEGCTVVRQYELRFLPVKSAETLANELNQQGLIRNVIIKTLNGLQAVEYISDGLCSNSVVVVIGSKANYQFSGTCEFNPINIENIARTIQLI